MVIAKSIKRNFIFDVFVFIKYEISIILFAPLWQVKILKEDDILMLFLLPCNTLSRQVPTDQGRDLRGTSEDEYQRYISLLPK